MIYETDLAYTAGTLDSDGSIGVIKSKRKQNFTGYVVRFDVAMSTSGVPTWLHAKFGGCLFEYNKNYRNGRRTMWRWGLYGAKACELLTQLLPYLIEKKSRAELAIELQSLARGRTTGNKRPPQDWIDKRDAVFSKIQAINLQFGRGGINQHSKKEIV